jgi:hypothetical protein
MERQRVPIRLTEEARAGLDRYCTRERITLTALLEALGLEEAEDHDVLAPAVVERAAAIDRERKSRR